MVTPFILSPFYFSSTPYAETLRDIEGMNPQEIIHVVMWEYIYGDLTSYDILKIAAHSEVISKNLHLFDF